MFYIFDGKMRRTEGQRPKLARTYTHTQFLQFLTFLRAWESAEGPLNNRVGRQEVRRTTALSEFSSSHRKEIIPKNTVIKIKIGGCTSEWVFVCFTPKDFCAFDLKAAEKQAASPSSSAVPNRSFLSLSLCVVCPQRSLCVFKCHHDCTHKGGRQGGRKTSTAVISVSLWVLQKENKTSKFKLSTPPTNSLVRNETTPQLNLAATFPNKFLKFTLLLILLRNKCSFVSMWLSDQV